MSDHVGEVRDDHGVLHTRDADGRWRAAFGGPIVDDTKTKRLSKKWGQNGGPRRIARNTGDPPEGKARFAKVTRPQISGSYCVMPVDAAKEELESAFAHDEPGDNICFEIVEMTPEEWQGMPEFNGW